MCKRNEKSRLHRLLHTNKWTKLVERSKTTTISNFQEEFEYGSISLVIPTKQIEISMTIPATEDLVDPRSIVCSMCKYHHSQSISWGAYQSISWSVTFKMGIDVIRIDGLSETYICELKKIISKAIQNQHFMTIDFKKFKKSNPKSVNSTFIITQCVF